MTKLTAQVLDSIILWFDWAKEVGLVANISAIPPSVSADIFSFTEYQVFYCVEFSVTSDHSDLHVIPCFVYVVGSIGAGLRYCTAARDSYVDNSYYVYSEEDMKLLLKRRFNL